MKRKMGNYQEFAAGTAVPGTVCTFEAETLGCHDCGLGYHDDRWIETDLPDEIWALISPKGGAGGLLCIACIQARLKAAGLHSVPVILCGHGGEGVPPLRQVSVDEAYLRGFKAGAKSDDAQPPGHDLRLYHVQDGDRPVYVAATSYAAAIQRWRNLLATENPGDDCSDDEPDGVTFVADVGEILLPCHGDGRRRGRKVR